MSINNVILTGRAGKDPELRFFESGSAVAHFSVAVDRNTDDADGPDWFDVEVWGKSATTVSDYVRKGSRIGLEGRLQQQKWTDRKTGEQRNRVVVSAWRVEFMDTKAERESRQQASTGPSAAAASLSPRRQSSGSKPGAWGSTAPEGDQVPF